MFAHRAFTLIELLIVVAIIAILAAIAVPNFLEAQVRAKVSRVQNDMRSVATALESYRIDGNSYPVVYPENNWVNGFVDGAFYAFLTTPISYITAGPKDPFVADVTRDGWENYYRYQDRFSYNRAANRPSGADWGWFDHYGPLGSGESSGVHWAL